MNLDEIARGLSPIAPDAERVDAARIALARIDALLQANGDGGDFSIETTLAGLTYLRRLRTAKARGWAIHLLYFAVATPEAVLTRIARRVSEGGHDVPEPEARRRFARSSANFAAYAKLADLWRVFDNNGPQPRAVAEGSGDTVSFRGDLAGLPAGLREALGAMGHRPG